MNAETKDRYSTETDVKLARLVASLAIAVIAVLGVATFAGAASPYATGDIASTAESLNGTQGGQCKAFVNNVVNRVVGISLSGYQQGFARAGAVQVDPAKIASLGLSLEDLRSASPLFAEDALSIDAESSVRSRDVPGGTAPNRVREAIGAARQRIDDFLAELVRVPEPALPGFAVQVLHALQVLRVFLDEMVDGLALQRAGLSDEGWADRRAHDHALGAILELAEEHRSACGLRAG